MMGMIHPAGISRPACLLVAAGALGLGMYAYNDAPAALAVALLGLALAAAVVGLLCGGGAPLSVRGAQVAGIWAAVQGAMLLVTPPGGGITPAAERFRGVYWISAGMLAVMAFFLPRMSLGTGRRLATGMGAALVLAGGWVLCAVPRPMIDVDVFHREAIAHLLAGGNPYDMTFTDIYVQRTGTPAPFYPAHFSADGRMQFGFPYPPLSLLLTVPGYLLGDHRLSMLLAMLGTAAVMLLLPDRRADASAGESAGPRTAAWHHAALAAVAIFLTTPQALYVLENSWTEPLAALLLAGVVWCALCRRRWTAVMFGLLLAIKQYMILLIPLALLLMPRPWRWGQVLRFYAVAAISAAVITLPLVLWNLPAAYHSLVEFQTQAQFRADALSVPALLAIHWPAWSEAAGWLPWVVVLPVYGLIACRAMRTPAGFALSAGLVLLIFFAFSKQAFINYYYLVAAAFCLAAAAQDVVELRKGAPARGEAEKPEG